MIWFKNYTRDELKGFMTHKNILQLMDIDFHEIGDDFLSARMKVDDRVHQIHGILHGGASCVLAESVGSFASLMCIDPSKKYAVGSQIMANHLRPISEGYITATAKPVHLGRTKHVWDIPITADNGKLIAKCELTCAITDKPHG
jgi:1,4-dihydroxy-2-naphthoyl-CoA hydrolase